MARGFYPLNVAFLAFCLFMTIIYGQEIYKTKLEGGFAFSNTLFFMGGILGLISLACNPRFAKISILVSPALFFLMSVYEFILTVASIGLGSGLSPSIAELLLPLVIGALTGLTFLTNFTRKADKDSDTRAQAK